MRVIKTSRSNHAVGEIYKSHAKLNIHDPDNQYRWADEPTSEQVRLVRILRVLGVISAVILLGVML